MSGYIQVSHLAQEFNPANTFFIGQVFNWIKTDRDIYCGTLNDKLLEISVHDNLIKWTLTPFGSESEVQSYLNLDISLQSLTNRWKSDKFFRSVYSTQPGVRILKQPVFECLISFICSQNSNVGKIAKNIQSIKERYGKKICFKHNRTWYSFPTIEELSSASQEVLQQFGLGYRSKYIVSAVKQIKDKGGELWIESLTELKTEEIKAELMKLKGVGPKVADCILLFSFNRFSVVPIDVHMWNIAKKYYNGRTGKSLTKGLYQTTQNDFVQALGDHAGWAHSILFAASLKKEIPVNPKKKVV